MGRTSLAQIFNFSMVAFAISALVLQASLDKMRKDQK